MSIVCSFKPLFIFFQICGLQPSLFNPHARPTTSSVSFVWSTLVMFVLVIKIVLLYVYAHLILYTTDIVGFITDLLKISTLFLSNAVILCIAVSSHHQLLKILQLTQSIEDNIQRGYRPNQDTKRSFQLKYLLELLCFVLPFIVAELNVFLAFENGSKSKYFFLVSILPIWIQNIQCFQFVFFVDVQAYFIGMLNKDMEQIVLHSTLNVELNSQQYQNYIDWKLKKLQDLHRLLVNYNDELNRYFGLSQFVNLIHVYFQVLCDAYWIIFYIFNGLTGLVFDVAWCSIPKLYTILVSLHSSQACMDLADNTIRILHRIKFKPTDHESNFEQVIEHFSMQILKNPIVLSANGIFDLGFRPISLMLSSMITHLVLFIQFVPKYKAQFINDLGLGKAS